MTFPGPANIPSPESREPKPLGAPVPLAGLAGMSHPTWVGRTPATLYLALMALTNGFHVPTHKLDAGQICLLEALGAEEGRKNRCADLWVWGWTGHQS